MTRAYQRVNFRGHTLNRRTVAMIEQAEKFLGFQLEIMQGSYNGGSGKVSASAGTHDGGGAVDFAWIANATKRNKVVWVLWMVGFAVWPRTELWSGGSRVWPNHIHGIAIGDQDMSQGAAKQIQDYYAGLNGLAGHAKDSTRRPNPIPKFQYPLKVVDLSNLQEQAKLGAKSTKKKALPGIRVVQQSLNVKTGTHLKVDGVFGATTKAAFARYEKQVGGDGDGIPGEFALSQLGLSRFTVKA